MQKKSILSSIRFYFKIQSHYLLLIILYHYWALQGEVVKMRFFQELNLLVGSTHEHHVILTSRICDWERTSLSLWCNVFFFNTLNMRSFAPYALLVIATHDEFFFSLQIRELRSCNFAFVIVDATSCL